MKNPEVIIFAIINFIAITIAITGYLKNNASAENKATQAQDSKPVQIKEQDPANIRFDSIALSKVSDLILDESKIDELVASGKKPEYTRKDFETEDQKFNYQAFFTAQELGLISEAVFYEILEHVYPKHYEVINQYHLRKTCISGIKDKQRLVDLVNQTNQYKFSLENNLIIEANQFYNDKNRIKEIIERVKKLDDDEFRSGTFGKYNFINDLLLRYAYKNIDEYALQNNREIAGILKENKKPFKATDLHFSSIDAILYFEPIYCLNTLSYIYINVNEETKEQLKPLIDLDSDECTASFMNKDLVGIEETIAKAKDAGIQNFEFTPLNRLFLNSDYESYGDKYPITKIIQYSNTAFPFIEVISEKIDPVHLNAQLYFHHMKTHFNDVQYLTIGNKSYVLIVGRNDTTYGFDVSNLMDINHADNKLTNIFNYVLKKQGDTERLIPMPTIFETLMISEPSKTKSFLHSFDLSTEY